MRVNSLNKQDAFLFTVSVNKHVVIEIFLLSPIKSQSMSLPNELRITILISHVKKQGHLSEMSYTDKPPIF